MTADDVVDFRPLNVAVAGGSRAIQAYAKHGGIAAETLAAGFGPRPDLDLKKHHGHTISDLAFINCYLGGSSSWQGGDNSNIDKALSDAMSDAGLQAIIAQYFNGPISSTLLKSEFVDGNLGARFFKDNAEQLVAKLASQGLLGGADPASTVINLFLPEGVILVDGNSDGSSDDAPHARAVLVDDDQADSTQGLGGYHGSVPNNGAMIYYAIGVYSKGNNGIVAFPEPWQNIVATFYHELNEARTDADVEDVIRTGKSSELGWYSPKGGEIGDIPMTLAGNDLSLVMKEVRLTNGNTVPIQLMWSNRDHGPAEPTGSPAAATA
jgi:hypothetical protein